MNNRLHFFEYIIKIIKNKSPRTTPFEKKIERDPTDHKVKTLLNRILSRENLYFVLYIDFKKRQPCLGVPIWPIMKILKSPDPWF